MSNTRILRLEQTQSTNADALRLARDGEAGPLWVLAREQIDGRGRRGRSWHSPPGNLYASLLLIDPATADLAPQLGFVAGVALVDSIRDLLGIDRVRLKWPNDLLCAGAKLTGILLEATRRDDGALICVVGIGVNCRSHPSELAYPTTDLSTVAGRDVSPDDLHPYLDRAFLRRLAEWDRGRNFAAIREAWLATAHGLGQPITATLHGGAVEGMFATIDGSGRLVVETATGRRTVDAGDIAFQSQPVPA